MLICVADKLSRIHTRPVRRHLICLLASAILCNGGSGQLSRNPLRKVHFYQRSSAFCGSRRRGFEPRHSPFQICGRPCIALLLSVDRVLLKKPISTVWRNWLSGILFLRRQPKRRRRSQAVYGNSPSPYDSRLGRSEHQPLDCESYGASLKKNAITGGFPIAFAYETAKMLVSLHLS